MENIYFSLVKMIAILAAMVFGMIFFYRHARKMNFSSLLRPKDGPRNLKKTGSLHLGFRSFVTVVEVENQVLVIGSSDKDLRLLARWRKDGGGVS